MPFKRPEVLRGNTRRLNTPCGSFYLMINSHDDKPVEIQMTIGKSGNCVRTAFQIIGILVSMLLQKGFERKEIIDIFDRHLKEANCGNKVYYKGEEYHSCLDYMAKQVLKQL
jgi:ribonucleoside-diphosphate reductase alpha chain